MTTLTGQVAIQTLRRIEASSDDSAHTLFQFGGDVFSRRAGEADRLLFRVDGMLIRATEDVSDPERGDGFRRLGREMMIFSDPITGEILDEWINPFTGARVEVLPVANDHVNATYHERDRQGSPFELNIERSGPHWSYRQSLQIRRPNPLGAGFELQIGGMYHAVELFAFTGMASQMDNLSVAALDAAVSWSRISDWFPWMNMEGREGTLYVHTTGAKLNHVKDLSPLLTQVIQKRFPAFLVPPPSGDTVPMDTSWTEYKVIKESGTRWYE